VCSQAGGVPKTLCGSVKIDQNDKMDLFNLLHGRSSNHSGLDWDDQAIGAAALEVTGINFCKKLRLWHDGFHFLTSC